MNKKKVTVKYFYLILITWEGNELPGKISLYESKIKIRIRPFVETVKQCYNCLKFGHVKAMCEAPKVCIGCSWGQ